MGDTNVLVRGSSELISKKGIKILQGVWSAQLTDNMNIMKVIVEGLLNFPTGGQK
jgi:hypothetical protein